MDYPRAWAMMDDTSLEDHDPRCSYRTEGRALLCDCAVLMGHADVDVPVGVDGLLYREHDGLPKGAVWAKDLRAEAPGADEKR